MLPKIPEQNKKPGVCYAVTDDGLELPVIDITHPAFALEVSEAEMSVLIDGMLVSIEQKTKAPPAVMQALIQKSILLRGLEESAGTFTTGMVTYLTKLGPGNLGEGYASPIDRQWAATLTPVSFRLRMQAVVRLVADGLAASLEKRPGQPAHLLNIGGGPAADSLDALILVRKEHPGLLEGRSISIHVLDLDAAGPHFGGRALEALLAEGAPLHGLSISFEYIPYNWSDTAPLRSLLERIGPGHAVAASSEGGLFEYASDEDIAANLAALRTAAADDFVICGPVIKDGETLEPRLKISEHVPGRPAVRYLGLAAFQRITAAAGWQVGTMIDQPMYHIISLRKA